MDASVANRRHDDDDEPTMGQSVIKIEMFPDGGYKKHQSALARSLSQMSMPCTYDDFEHLLLQLTWLCKTRYDLLAPVTKLHEVRRSNFSRNDIHLLNKTIRQANSHYSRGLFSHRLDRDSFQLVVFTSASPVDRGMVSNMSFVVILVDDSARANFLRCASFQTEMSERSLLYAQLYIFLVAFDFALPLRQEVGKLINARVPLYILSDSKPLADILKFYQRSRHSEELPPHELVNEQLALDFQALHDACRRTDIKDVGYVEPSQNLAGCFLRNDNRCIALENLLDTGKLELSVDHWAIHIGVDSEDEIPNDVEIEDETDIGSKIESENETGDEVGVAMEGVSQLTVGQGNRFDAEDSVDDHAFEPNDEPLAETRIQNEDNVEGVADNEIDDESQVELQAHNNLNGDQVDYRNENDHRDGQAVQQVIDTAAHHETDLVAWDARSSTGRMDSNAGTRLSDDKDSDHDQDDFVDSMTAPAQVVEVLVGQVLRNSDPVAHAPQCIDSENDEEGQRFVDAVEGPPEEKKGHGERAVENDGLSSHADATRAVQEIQNDAGLDPLKGHDNANSSVDDATHGNDDDSAIASGNNDKVDESAVQTILTTEDAQGNRSSNSPVNEAPQGGNGTEDSSSNRDGNGTVIVDETENESALMNSTM